VRIGATSERPLADLCNLRGTCSTMRRVCGHDEVGRHLSIEGIQDEIYVWDPTAYKDFLAMLIDLGNPGLTSPGSKPVNGRFWYT
jgi:hypothetical protein